MVANQWEYASKFLLPRLEETGSQLIDYGCGQGLAGLLLHDYIGSTFLANVATIVAVEPSAVALKRAEAIYRSLSPAANVVPVNKAFDSLQHTDFGVGSSSTLHLFSNVLDIDGYDHIALLRKALSPGRHTIIAVGHDRTSHGYSQGLPRVKSAVDSGGIGSGVTAHFSQSETFTCGNRQVPCVLWLCKLEVSDE